jgi:tRNA (mo5U34)-methyltransferase
MKNFQRLFDFMRDTELEPWLKTIETQIQQGLCNDTYGKLAGWKKALSELPEITARQVDLNLNEITVFPEVELSDDNKTELKNTLKQLMPWRKGPFNIHGIEIDTEWRSDFKWQRLMPKIKPLKGKKILDVGCGNGYHGWRMRGMGAELVMGIDPSPLFVMQFQAMQHFINDEHVYVLPLGIEAVPDDLKAFDTVFSMGVFYHRKSPIDHLYQLKQCLKPGGELVLETLVIKGDEMQVLMPEDRYAQMRNVWFLPSSEAMIKWLQRCGFKNVKLIDESYTTPEEQRSTEWMQFHSLSDFLDPHDSSKTIEGYSAPLRAIFSAEAP